MKRNLGWIALSVIAIAMASITFAQPAPSTSSDPCMTYAKLTQPIAASTAGTTRIINNTAGPTSQINICSVALYSVGGTSTLEYGTGTACATAATAVTLTGAFAASSTFSLGSGNATVINIPPVASTLTSTTGNGLCLLAGASTTATAGYVTYVVTAPM